MNQFDGGLILEVTYMRLLSRVEERLTIFSDCRVPSSFISFISHYVVMERLLSIKSCVIPTPILIGEKQNGEVKVKAWLNVNWVKNAYMKARSQKCSVDSLWNTIKMKGVYLSKQVSEISKLFYRTAQNNNHNFHEENICFEKMKDYLRQNYSKLILEGRFALQRNKKDHLNSKNTVFITNKNLFFEPSIRPRAISEQLRKGIKIRK